jgi:methionyl-tRNA synthetase
LYCVGCEQFTLPRDLHDGRCPLHGVAPESFEEENYFFRLSRYQDRLTELLRSDALRVTPLERKREALSFVQSGLSDFSISRSLQRAGGWGIPVPDDPSQILYVWFDALVGYLSALGFPDGAGFERYWSHARSRLHVIGKDILRFHAVYWPAILLSVGEAPPTDLLVHGFLSVNGQKIGKSSGNAVDPLPLAAQHGSDALRHYFTRHLPTTLDADFSVERLAEAYRSELAGKLGNLVTRTQALVIRHCPEGPPRPGAGGPPEHDLIAALEQAEQASSSAWDALDPNLAARSLWQAVAAANRYLDQRAPWQLARRQQDREQLEAVLESALSAIERIARLARPLLPAASSRIGLALAKSEPAPLVLFPLTAPASGSARRPPAPPGPRSTPRTRRTSRA